MLMMIMMMSGSNFSPESGQPIERTGIRGCLGGDHGFLQEEISTEEKRMKVPPDRSMIRCGCLLYVDSALEPGCQPGINLPGSSFT